MVPHRGVDALSSALVTSRPNPFSSRTTLSYFLPVPGRDYLAFRMSTAYGSDFSGDASDDLVTYLRWCKAWPHLAR